DHAMFTKRIRRRSVECFHPHCHLGLRSAARADTIYNYTGSHYSTVDASMLCNPPSAGGCTAPLPNAAAASSALNSAISATLNRNFLFRLESGAIVKCW